VIELGRWNDLATELPECSARAILRKYFDRAALWLHDRRVETYAGTEGVNISEISVLVEITKLLAWSTCFVACVARVPAAAAGCFAHEI